MSQTVFVLEDDTDISRLVQHHLEAAGFSARLFHTPTNLIPDAERQPPALFLLDIMVPGGDGLDVCRRLRSHTGLSTIPIIFLTARAGENDRVLGLELGADDYITKPFSLREFSSRIKAALRRAEMSRPDQAMPGEAPLDIRELRIDFAKRSVRIRGDDAQLTYVEFEILSALARAPGRVFTRDMLLARIWGDSAYRDPRTIDVHIRHLREKVERDPKDPEYLFTVRGVGYRFDR